AAHQNDRSTVLIDTRLEWREVLSFAVASGDEHGRPADAFERRERRRDRRSLGVVHEQHAADLGDPLHAMRQSFEARERGEDVPMDVDPRGAGRARGRRVEGVVPAYEPELALREQECAPPAEPRTAIARDEAPVVLALRRIAAEGLHGSAWNAHRPREPVVA